MYVQYRWLRTVDTLVSGTLVNVHKGTLEERDVAIDDDEIVALEKRPAERRIEAGYITPRLIDAHMHVGTLSTPSLTRNWTRQRETGGRRPRR